MTYTDAERGGIMAVLPARLAAATRTHMKSNLAEQPERL
ncbi:hypothetical protein GGI59_000210 [Rhizobium lentis]|uniref:Uncharacterized protein n=2 Tax=Rhizobium TaxID=379 RepID=A0A7W8UIN2_9HYPH|nr:hypothetical protein [Rhizobium lentis]MBB5548056.1 hypothetical protein [Rhizobium lentis]MBB5558583.1 hypothetical protein [Rhizobium lentis]MBB5565893.1 hypothetical protein [Rhizobium lentis]